MEQISLRLNTNSETTIRSESKLNHNLTHCGQNEEGIAKDGNQVECYTSLRRHWRTGVGPPSLNKWTCAWKPAERDREEEENASFRPAAETKEKLPLEPDNNTHHTGDSGSQGCMWT